MQLVRKYQTNLGRNFLLVAGALGLLLFAGARVQAQTVGADNFADAPQISGPFGTFTTDTTGATVEENEPNHAGQPPASTVWFKFLAPYTAEVQVDLAGSSFLAVLSVYKGTSLANLDQIAASIPEQVPPVGFDRPAKLLFNAVAGQTYYFAVGGVEGMNQSSGDAVLNFAYNPSGSFRFARLVNIPMVGVLPIYEAGESETSTLLVGAVDDPITFLHDQPGVVLTVTRDFGYNGKVLVDFETVDLDAAAGVDFLGIKGTLTFNEFEMSKSLCIPILWDGGDPMTPQSNRVFSVVLSNPRLDDLELQDDVAPPKLDPLYSTAFVQILDVDIDPVFDNNFDTNGVFAGPSNSVFNIEKRVIRLAEDSEYAVVYINRFGTNNEAVDLVIEVDPRNNAFVTEPGSDYATPSPENTPPPGIGVDFGGGQVTIGWGQNDFQSKAVAIPIVDDTREEFNEDIPMIIYRVVNGRRVRMGNLASTTITILYDPPDVTAGTLDYAHNPDMSVGTTPPSMLHPGADGMVYDLAVVAGDKSVIVGDFGSYNTVPRRRIARINVDGSLDNSFDPGEGANGYISTLGVQTDGRLLIGGAFSFYNGVQRNGIARVSGDGSLDDTFNPGLGVDGVVRSVALQSDGKIIIGGQFTSYNGTNCINLARLNPDGSLDTTFSTTANPLNGPVNAVAVTPGGLILAGGEFSAAGPYTINNLARFTETGALDTGFRNKVGLGVNGVVYALAVQSDSRVLLGGEFTAVNVSSRTRLARLNTDGSVDTGFDPGVGANDTVYAITPTPAGIYIAGLFTSYNGTRRSTLARLFGNGSVDTSFMDTAYNHYAGLCRDYFNTFLTPQGVLYAVKVQADGGVMIAGSFDRVGGGFRAGFIQPSGVEFEEGDEFLSYEPYHRASMRHRNNVARLIGGSTEGPGNITFNFNSYTINQQQSFLRANLVRSGGSLGQLAANFSVASASALSGRDFIYNSPRVQYGDSYGLTRMQSHGLVGTNTIMADVLGRPVGANFDSLALITIPNPNLAGDRYAQFQLANPSMQDILFLGSENTPIGGALGRPSAQLSIIDDNTKPGSLAFSSLAYSISEGSNAVINVVRTNGATGTLTVQFATTNTTALYGVDYFATNGTLTFLSGQTSKTFTVRTINNGLRQPVDRTLGLRLFALNGPTNAVLATTNAQLSIVDDDWPPGYLNFAVNPYTVNESAGSVTLTVTRTGGAQGTVTVQCGTTNGSALSGVHYVGLTNLLAWNNGDSSPRYVTVPLIKDGLTGPNTSFEVRLLNATVDGTNSSVTLGGATTRTTVNIINDDRVGDLQFSAPSYLVNENGGYATVTVLRRSGHSESLSVNYTTADGTAVGMGALPNYVPASGTLVFGPGEVAASFTVPILDNAIPDAMAPEAFFFNVALTNASRPGVIGALNVAQVRIIDAQAYNYPAGSLDHTFSPDPGFDANVNSLWIQPDGKILTAGDFTMVNSAARTRLARINTDGSLDTGFLTGLGGANASVRTVLQQSDQRILVGGNFTAVNGVFRNGLARLLIDGNIDTSFNPGSGANGPVLAVVETFVSGQRQILVGGNFSTMAGTPRSGLARLNNEGWLDPNFNAQLNVNGAVYAIAVYPTNTIEAGKILIGGDFSTVNGVARTRLARLNSDGTLDPTFNPGTGADGTVRVLTLQPDGRILVGGSFTNFNGAARNHLTRLNVDGSTDPGFNVGLGADATVQAILLQPDNRIILAGQFTRASGVTRDRITRLLPDGTVDPFINFGLAADDQISAVGIQTDGNLVLAGSFKSYDAFPRSGLARIYGGSLAGSGTLEFANADYSVLESEAEAGITLRRRWGTEATVSVHFDTANGTAVAGVNYQPVSATVTFPPGETFQKIFVPIQPDLQVTPDLTVALSLHNVTPPAGMGNQPTATLTIQNTDSTFSFSSASYFRSENAIDGAASLEIVRSGSTREAASVEFMTTTNGTAIANTNYVPTAALVPFAPGQSSVSVKIPLLRDTRVQGDTTVEAILTNAVNSLLATPNVATVTILDVDQSAGRLAFQAPTYSASESGGQVAITVVRTNGTTGLVSVNIATADGTAQAGIRYVQTNGVLTFANGEITKTFYVTLLDTALVEGDQAFQVTLSNPTGGASILGSASVPVTVIDDETGIGFASPIYIGSETAGSVTLALRRVGTNGSTSVTYTTTNFTATAGTNYQSATGVLTFAPGETYKTFNISLLHDPRVTGDLSFLVNLSGLQAPAQFFPPSTATVVVLDSDPGLAFTNQNFYAVKSGTNVLISVLRSNANTGLVTVDYATSDDTAEAGIDYIATSGTLTFSNGISLQSFTVPIINNRLVRGDRRFTLDLFNPSAGAQLVFPSTSSVTITDDVAGLTFSAPAYSVSEKGVGALITVERVGFTNSAAAVNYATADGTALSGVNYQPVSGTLSFAPGETVKTFIVPVINNSILEGDKTVLLSLSGVAGNAVLVNPAATLTIVEADGSLILPAGTALVSESGTQNGVIDPNETVTLLFGLRNSLGTNTANLVATLAPTNGLTNPSGPQTYGVLVVGGPSVSRPYTFTAAGTNGQVINARLQLQDGDLATEAMFSFTIGRGTQTFSNTAPIVINDATNAAPYPSILNVSGLGGSIIKATVTLSNLSHIWPADINMILVSPSNQKTYLMSKAGGALSINNVTLHFDDSTNAVLPQSTRIASGTYRPTSYATTTPPFPIPAPPGPYQTNLAAFNGSNPNGAWSLYVFDDTPLYAGILSNGWSLTLTTSELVPSASDLGVSVQSPTAPIITGENSTYVVAVTNYGPGSALGVVVTDPLPAGLTYIASSATTGSVATNAAGLVTWTVGNMAKDAGARLTLTVRPTATGSLTNTATVAVSGTDPNPDNNSASAVAMVVAPSSDLALTLIGWPNPIQVGDALTYTMVISNKGPSTAANLSLTNTLPPSATFVSATPAGAIRSGNIVAFPSLGSLAAYSTLTATITVTPTMPGEITDTAICATTTFDPTKANNVVRDIKIIVESTVPVTVTATRSGSNLVLSWPVTAGAYILQETPGLGVPWTDINPPRTTNAGVISVTLPATGAGAYYRLKK